eukprot:EC716221.1.p1 GENE.EC716221.1~~EC716221.1.p1  ORF type:complete len:168 (-),score=7.73 EC716221.1:93-596(-)
MKRKHFYRVQLASSTIQVPQVQLRRYTSRSEPQIQPVLPLANEPHQPQHTYLQLRNRITPPPHSTLTHTALYQPFPHRLMRSEAAHGNLHAYSCRSGKPHVSKVKERRVMSAIRPRYSRAAAQMRGWRLILYAIHMEIVTMLGLRRRRLWKRHDDITHARTPTVQCY